LVVEEERERGGKERHGDPSKEQGGRKEKSKEE